MAVAAVILILPVPVPAVVVKPVGAALLNAVVVALETASVPALNVRFFVPAAVMKEGVVNVNPARSSVPAVSVYAPVEIAEPRVNVPLLWDMA